MKPTQVEDRTAVVTFDVSDADQVVQRYTVTSANTVIVQNRDGSFEWEHAFENIVAALGWAIEQTGFAMVVDELLTYSEDEDVQGFAVRHPTPSAATRSDGVTISMTGEVL